jgi:hypothetical protein
MEAFNWRSQTNNLMQYFYIEPEVAGGLGSSTLLDSTVHPPVVERLEYCFDGWQGDALLESFPCFITTESLAAQLMSSSMSGIQLGHVSITKSREFLELYPHRSLPVFVWLRVTGQAGNDDLGIAVDGRLVVSDRALTILKAFGISHSLVEEFAQ